MQFDYSLEESSVPATYPLSVSDLRDYCYITGSDDDAQLAQFQAEAVDDLEKSCATYVRSATIVERYNCWPLDYTKWWQLNRYPVQSVTTIEYLDSDGDTQTWDSANYEVDIYHCPGRITLAENVSTPTLDESINRVVVTYTAGHVTIPDCVKAAIKGRVYSMYECRGMDPAEQRVWDYAIRHLHWSF